MQEFKMTLTETNNKAGRNWYQVFDADGNKIGERRTNRTYVAAYVFQTPSGELYVNFWFGRIDLIGKGVKSIPTGVAILTSA